MESNIIFYKKTKTKNGRDVSSWIVPCINCKEERVINRKDHAIRLSKTKCKKCSNKSNHPQGDYKGIRISFFNKFKLNAISRDLEFKIDIDFASKLAESQNYKCYYSDLELKFNGDFNQITASIDRIDSSIGYLESNICWVHKDINMMKQKFSEKKFVEMCKLVANKVKW